MSKEDTAQGLLSKMVKFVRNPTTSWSALDQAESVREDSVSKQLIKEMIERKRRNDFVRKREFDMLRKMRKREALAGVGQDPDGRPSFFQSSLPSRPDDRASTLKKIDEIEAQMSMQWWKTKGGVPLDIPPGNLSSRKSGGDVPKAAPMNHSPPLAYPLTVPSALQSSAAAAAKAATAPVLRAVQAGAEALVVRDVLSAASGPASPASRSPAARGYLNANTDFSASKFSAMESGALVTHDTELEEAAIRFANGDEAGAEAGLLEILDSDGSRTQHIETWLTLFDLYRATAQQDKFEVAAISFVERFNRSAPQWFSMPDMVKMLSQPSGQAGHGPAADWICPSVVGMQSVAALKAALLKAATPWRLDWSNLKTIEEAAVEPLCRIFSAWAAQPVQLRFIGDVQLQKVLRDSTPSGDRARAQSCWQLRMEALRVTNQLDDFELAALDFCVTYEVSPPSWENARCQYKPLDDQGGTLGAATIIGDVYRDSVPSTSMVMDGDSLLDSRMSQMSQMSQFSNQLAVELSGQIQGDAIAVFDKLGAKLNGADVMLISCAKLIRVDFSAAGTLLNWVSARQAENREVQFSEVNRLVAAFFNVIGITEHAKVVVRVD